MRFIAALLLFAAFIPTQEGAPCVVSRGVYSFGYYRLSIPHEEVSLGLSYTAEPPAELITQYYTAGFITYTTTISVTDPPPPHTEVFTYTRWVSTYSETTDVLGYVPFTAHPPDYAYGIRSPAPFQVWKCAVDGRPHIFLPLVNSPAVN